LERRGIPASLFLDEGGASRRGRTGGRRFKAPAVPFFRDWGEVTSTREVSLFVFTEGSYEAFHRVLFIKEKKLERKSNLKKKFIKLFVISFYYF